MFNRSPQDELAQGIRDSDRLTRYVAGFLSSPRSRVIATAWLGGLGLVLLLSGFLVLRAGERFGARAARAEGEVISTTRRPIRDSHGTQQFTNDPIVRFRTAGGQDITVAITRSSQVESYPVGRRVPVLYDPADPSTARIAGDANAWMVPFVLFTMGGAVLFGAGGILRLVLTDRKAEASFSRTGQRVAAKIVSIRTTEMAQGPPIWSVEAEWTDPSSGRVLVFRSKEVREDPAGLHGQVTVVFDPADPRQYHMESPGNGIH